VRGDRLKARISRIRAASGVEAVSDCFGMDRGLPILRYYMERFLEEFRADVRGQCLEFEAAWYTQRFGGDAVTASDVLHIDDSNPLATIVADLTQPNDVASEQFDCVICTFTLHLVYEYEKLVSDLHRVLKPGGVLLVGAPTVSMSDPDWHELWRFTPEGLAALLQRTFPGGEVLVRGYGNSLTAAGQMRGLAAQEFTAEELDYSDPRFAVLACGRAVRAHGNGRAL